MVVAEREAFTPVVAGTEKTILSARLGETPVLQVDEFINKIRVVELPATNEGLSIRGGGMRKIDLWVNDISVHDPRLANSSLSLKSTAVKER